MRHSAIECPGMVAVEWLTTQTRRRRAIEARIAARGGTAEPIETRQLKAIAEEIALAGLDPDAPRGKRLPPMDQRIEAVFPGNDLLYDFGYRTGSDAMHGGWKDLISHHIDPQDGFAPRLEWWPVDPIPLFAATLTGSLVMRQYAAAVGADAATAQSLDDTRDLSENALRTYGTYYDKQRG